MTQPSHNTPEWREGQRHALAASGILVSECHPWKAAMKDPKNPGAFMCGELSCRKPVERRAPNAKADSHGYGRIEQKAKDGYQPEPPPEQPYEPGVGE